MGGEHKCPLCDATFTRPQHVGRHLRAHTGDRPYECKSCPLRFARSDLLSRHVNKAHKPPDPNDPPKKGAKRGRRKSMPTAERIEPPAPLPDAHTIPERPRRLSFADAEAHQRHETAAQFQAEQMYPHHPLLGGTNVPALVPEVGWTDSPMQTAAMLPGAAANNLAGPSFINPFTSTANATVSMPVTATQTPVMATLSTSPESNYGTQPGLVGAYGALPMRMSGSEQGLASPERWRIGYGISPGYEWGYKKRACDNCNHSKVRCDTGEPCQRCSNRNIPCTYNKPQKSRSIANFGQRMSVTMSSSGSGMSSSPSASSYSPYQSTIQPPLTAPPTHSMHDARRMAVPVMGVSEYAMPRTATFVTPQSQPGPQSWSLAPQVSNINPALLPGNQLDQYSPVNQASALPMTSQPFRPGPLPHPEHSTSMVGTNSTTSSQSLLHSTPALTASYSTSSPDSSEEPRDRSGSQGGSSMPNLIFSSGAGGMQKSLGLSEAQYPNGMGQITASPMAFIHNSLDSTGTDSALATVPWPNSTSSLGTMDPRIQFRSSVASIDEDAGSIPGSVRATTNAEHEDAHHASDHRRRSSAGTWAHALNGLSLQDGAAVGAVAANPGMDMSIPFVASQVAQAIQARRPSFPMFPMTAGVPGNQQEMSKPPSIGDVKDLWKLFMSEPMTGATPSKEGIDSLDMASRQTPRPGLGKRNLSTLSKRNSMPELMTPSFAQTLAQPQLGQPPSGPSRPSQVEAFTMDDQWSSAISQRHASFDIAPGDNLWGRTVPPSKAELMEGFGSRPLPAILQSSALQQTLAPERSPSFGMQSFDPLTPPVPSRLKQFQTPLKYMGSAAARPGAKRLSSQTLENAADKKRESLADDASPEDRTPTTQDPKAKWSDVPSYPHGATVSLPVTTASTPVLASTLPITMPGQTSWLPNGGGLQAVSRAS